MKWIATPVGLGDNPDVARLARACGISINETVGAITQLWGKYANHASSGVVADIPDDLLERWANQPCATRPGVFADAYRAAMCTPEGLDELFDEYNAAAIREAEYDANRRRAERERRRLEKERRAAEEAARLQAELELQDQRNTTPPPRPRGRRRGEQHHGRQSVGPSVGGSDATSHDITSNPSCPDGQESPSADRPAGQPDALTRPNSNGHSAAAVTPDWQREYEADLRDGASVVELQALDDLLAWVNPRARYTVLGELHMLAMGDHPIVGEKSKRQATMADVRSAWVQYVGDEKVTGWDVPLFRGFVHRCANAKPLATAEREEQTAARIAEAERERVLGENAMRAQMEARLSRVPQTTDWRSLTGAPPRRGGSPRAIADVIPAALSA